jgi:hypothetical protein
MALPPHPHHTGVIPDWLYHLAEGVTSSVHELLDDVSLLASALTGMVFNMAEDADEASIWRWPAPWRACAASCIRATTS